MEKMKKYKEVKVFNDEIKERLEEIKNGKELPDVVIDQVAGGRGKRAPSNDAEGITRMWCPKCGFQCTWAGDYLHRVYECPDCPGYMYGWLYEGPGGKRV